MKLSVIIPVFQVATTLEGCVESVLSQDYADLAAKHPQVHVIHQTNKGLSAARNTGIELSKGTYITFIDSDDTMGSNTLKLLMTELEQHPEYDILEYPVYLFYQSHTQKILTFPQQTYQDMTTYWLDGKAYEHTYACNKIYKRTLFQNVRFPEGRVFEDAFTLPQLLKKCHTIATTSKGMYYYYWNPKGITANAKGEELTQLLESHVVMLNQLKNNCTPKALKTYYEKVLNIQIDVCEMTTNSPSLPEIDFGWKCGSTKLFLKKIFGIRGLCKLYKNIHKLYRRSH